MTLYNTKLKNAIDIEIAAIAAAYDRLCKTKDKTLITKDEFENAISKELSPEKILAVAEETDICHRFERFIEDGGIDGIFGAARQRHYKVLLKELKRFLCIWKLSSIHPADFTAEMLIEFRRFLIDEYLFVPKYPSIYQSSEVRNIPTEKRSHNTVVAKLKELQAFFNELAMRNEIPQSPFGLVGKNRKTIMMREKYDTPVCLTIEEFETILQTTDVPDTLKETRDCFLLQCAFGCRVSDYRRLGMNNVSVSDEGIPYIHYVAKKTIKDDRSEIATPIMRFALDIIKERKFNFAILRYVNGHQGYNAKIKTLLKFCNINRQVNYYDAESNEMKMRPLYEVGGSKLARKTFVDLINKIQINMYLGGLHKQGSDAVKRYTNIGLRERFILYSTAFHQSVYTVDEKLNILTENNI